MNVINQDVLETQRYIRDMAHYKYLLESHDTSTVEMRKQRYQLGLEMSKFVASKQVKTQFKFKEIN